MILPRDKTRLPFPLLRKGHRTFPHRPPRLEVELLPSNAASAHSCLLLPSHPHCPHTGPSDRRATLAAASLQQILFFFTFFFFFSSRFRLWISVSPAVSRPSWSPTMLAFFVVSCLFVHRVENDLPDVVLFSWSASSHPTIEARPSISDPSHEPPSPCWLVDESEPVSWSRRPLT